MNNCTKLFTESCAVALLAFSNPTIVAAQDSEVAPSQARSNDTIVVTGSRLRQESVQETPIAVSVINSDAIDDLHAVDLTSLSTNAPSLVVATNPTGNQVPYISLRGFNVIATDISIEPGISVYVDGIYQPTIVGGLSDLFDVERVEVLRGPQSTLLGKNSSAGAILVQRTRPGNEFGGRVRVEYGTDDLIQAQALFNMPLIEDFLSAKLYGMYRKTDDYAFNQTSGATDLGGAELYTIRGGLLFTPNDRIDWYVTGDYTNRKTSNAAGRNAALPTMVPCAVFGYCSTPPQGSHFLDIDFNEGAEHDDYTASSDLEFSFGGAQIKMLTGYRDLTMYNNNDIDGTGIAILDAINQTTEIENFSHEIRLTSVEGGGWDFDGRLTWLIAGYYNDSSSYLYQPISVFGGTPNSEAQQSDRRTLAIFTHIDFDVNEDVSLSFGARQSWDKTEHSWVFPAPGFDVPAVLPFSQERNDDDLSIEAGAQYQIADQVMAYFRFSEGYRGGGFLGFPDTIEQAQGGYDPEESKSYEFGLRSELFNNLLQLNVTAYTARFENLQRSQTQPSASGGFIIVTDNIATARYRGVEVESILRPTDGFNILANASFLDPEYLEYASGGVDLSDTNFSYAPKWNASIRPSYEFDIRTPIFDRARLSGSWEYRSRYLAGAQDISELVQDGYSIVDLQMSLSGGHDHRYKLTGYVSNVGNERFQVYGVFIPPLLLQKFDERGRRYGVSLELDF